MSSLLQVYFASENLHDDVKRYCCISWIEFVHDYLAHEAEEKKEREFLEL